MGNCKKCNENDSHCGCNHYDGFSLTNLLGSGGATGTESTLGSQVGQPYTPDPTKPKKKIDLKAISGKVGNLISGIKNQIPNQNMGNNIPAPSYTPTPTAGGSNTGMIVGIVLAVVVVIGIFIYTQRKK